MKGEALSVPAMLFAGSIAANAQTIPPGLLGTTLDYQGTYMGMTGLTTTLYSGTQESGGLLPLVASAYYGTETGSITLEEINGAPWVAYSFALTGSPLTGNSGGNVYISGVLGSWGPPYTYYSDQGGTINLTTTNGAITGATVDLNDDVYNNGNNTLSIGPTGDAVNYEPSPPGSDGGTCQSEPVTFSEQYPNGIYTGPTIKNCNIVANNISAGVWTVTPAPELDPASTASGLTLLLGGLALLRGRRVVRT